MHTPNKLDYPNIQVENHTLSQPLLEVTNQPVPNLSELPGLREWTRVEARVESYTYRDALLLSQLYLSST